MAVDTTPERSFSDLLSSSRRDRGDHRMRLGRHRCRVIGGEHDGEGASGWSAAGIGEEGGDACQRLVCFGVEHVQDGAGQQGVAVFSQ